MRHDEILYGKLARLKLQLETLKLHGHQYVEFPGDYNWLARIGKATMNPIEIVAAQVESCELCPLAKTRTNAVFGVGDVKARLMFIGEAPGRDEDLKGEPFVGRAGALLTRMIKGMGLEREDVYIANIIKCRPPKNRNPEPVEVDNCEPYLKRQINIIKPEIICALGAVSAQTLLKTKTPISRLRGQFYQYEGAPLLPTFHPAYLLRNPSAKTDAWSDLQMIMEKLGLKIPDK
ncbi:Uracil-DNA glycosylase, family 4 [hydrothermal vent metagenome]|uniref:Type-4 uracil-DNA glycosylase n=1 Tax=hydrothermal vent metagenome TaxID=652676 RepID=A0A3B1D3F1_9ZZZZ